MRLGLVDEVVPDEAEARRLAAGFAEVPRDAYAAAKRALRAGALEPTEDETLRFHEEIPIWTSPELKARLTAMLRK